MDYHKSHSSASEIMNLMRKIPRYDKDFLICLARAIIQFRGNWKFLFAHILVDEVGVKNRWGWRGQATLAQL
jgi:hypothetical protein